MRRIAIIVGSKNDFAQCEKGLEWLENNQDKISVMQVYVASQHRHTNRVQEILTDLSVSSSPPDAIITGAGWANHLTGCCDAYLRYTLHDNKILVIGTAFEDLKQMSELEINPFDNHNSAAILSITCVPGTQVVYRDSSGKHFCGADGFYRACVYAGTGKFPQITLKEIPEQLNLSLTEALKLS
jgi:hypothetical protein